MASITEDTVTTDMDTDDICDNDFQSVNKDDYGSASTTGAAPLNDEASADVKVEETEAKAEEKTETEAEPQAEADEAESDDEQYDPVVVKTLRLANTKMKGAMQRRNDEVVHVLVDSVRNLLKLLPS